MFSLPLLLVVWILHLDAFSNDDDSPGWGLLLGLESSVNGRRLFGVDIAAADFNFSSESSVTSVAPSEDMAVKITGGEGRGLAELEGEAGESVQANLVRTSVGVVGGVIATSMNEPLDDSRRTFNFVESSEPGASEVGGVLSKFTLTVETDISVVVSSGREDALKISGVVRCQSFG